MFVAAVASAVACIMNAVAMHSAELFARMSELPDEEYDALFSDVLWYMAYAAAGFTTTLFVWTPAAQLLHVTASWLPQMWLSAATVCGSIAIPASYFITAASGVFSVELGLVTITIAGTVAAVAALVGAGTAGALAAGVIGGGIFAAIIAGFCTMLAEIFAAIAAAIVAAIAGLFGLLVGVLLLSLALGAFFLQNSTASSAAVVPQGMPVPQGTPVGEPVAPLAGSTSIALQAAAPDDTARATGCEQQGEGQREQRAFSIYPEPIHSPWRNVT